MEDLISRRKALDAIDKALSKTFVEPCGEMILKDVPSAQPEYSMDEWCVDCKEYDHERHCCPRFNRVIRETVDEVKNNQWIPCSEKLPDNRVCVIVCFREWQQYAKRYIYSIVTGWYARKHSVRKNVFSEWEADCDYDEDEDEFYIQEGWYEFTTEGNSDLMNWYISAEVVAWMPLPEPYQEATL